MTRLQCIPELPHWFTQATYWTLPIANLYHSSFKNSNTHNSLWLLRSKWTHQSIYVKWNPVSHSKFYSVTIVFPVQSPTIKPQGKSVSMNFLWQHLCSFSNSAVTNSISSEPQSPTHFFFSSLCAEGQKSKLKVWAPVFLLEASENAPIPFSASRNYLHSVAHGTFLASFNLFLLCSHLLLLTDHFCLPLIKTHMITLNPSG